MLGFLSEVETYLFYCIAEFTPDLYMLYDECRYHQHQDFTQQRLTYAVDPVMSQCRPGVTQQSPDAVAML